LNSQIEEQKGKIDNCTKQIAKVKVYDDKLKSDEMEKMGELSDAQVQEKNLQFQKSQLAKSIQELEPRISDLVDSMENEDKIPSYDVYKQTLKDIEDVERELKEESLRLCLLKIGSEIVSPDAIKRNIISKVVSSINAMINANLSELCVNFTCNLTNDMNDYEIQSSGGELDFPNLSLGEQMKLIISSQLAFRKFLISRFNVCMNIMIIDEVVDRALDSVSIQKLLGILLQLSQKENTNISIISHRGEVETMFKDMPETQMMVVQKQDNISKIVRD
jgi:DNA repair exonuclease SbcCD ATPase subunit